MNFLADSAGASIEGIFLQYGLIGAIALILGFYARGAIKATEERARRLEDDNRRLYEIMTSQMIPALTKANDTIAEAITIMGEIKRREERLAAIEEARRIAANDAAKYATGG